MFNSSLSTSTFLYPNDFNNNNCIDYTTGNSFRGDEILSMTESQFANNQQNISKNSNKRSKWKKAYLAVLFINFLKNSSKFSNQRPKIPLITFTSSSTLNQSPIKFIDDVEEDSQQNSERQMLVKKRSFKNLKNEQIYETPTENQLGHKTASIYFSYNPLAFNFNTVEASESEKKRSIKEDSSQNKKEETFVLNNYKPNSDPKQIISPNLKLYSIDLSSPVSSKARKAHDLIKYNKNNNYYYIKKSELRSLPLPNQTLTPLLITNLNKHNLNLENSGPVSIKPIPITDELTKSTKSSVFSCNTIPCLYDDDLNRLLRNEFNLHVLDDSKCDEYMDNSKCQNCIQNLFSILKTITSSITIYFIPSSEKKRPSENIKKSKFFRCFKHTNLYLNLTCFFSIISYKYKYLY